MTMKKKREAAAISTVCPDGHGYLPIGNTYYKNNESGEGRDNNVVYQMVYCQKCAGTLEIVVCDRRAQRREER
jgi:hypothetical protein